PRFYKVLVIKIVPEPRGLFLTSIGLCWCARVTSSIVSLTRNSDTFGFPHDLNIRKGTRDDANHHAVRHSEDQRADAGAPEPSGVRGVSRHAGHYESVPILHRFPRGGPAFARGVS